MPWVPEFAGEPLLHHPLRGRIEGEREFREFVADTDRWLRGNDASVEDVQRSVLPDRGFEEVVVHLKTRDGRVDLPHAMVADHTPEGRIEQIRVYFGTRSLTGRPTDRAPLLEVDPQLREQARFGGYVSALATGDATAVGAAALGERIVPALEVARGAAPKMSAGGSLVLIGGTGARKISREIGIGSAAVAAMAAFTATLALELAPIRVNLINPGFVDTGLSARVLGDGLEERRQELRRQLPIGRVIEPTDVAALAVQLMANTAITGAGFDIDGGQRFVE